MSAGDLAIVIAAVLCSIGFAALIVVLVRVLDALRVLRNDVSTMRAEMLPLLGDLRTSTVDAKATIDAARHDLDRFDRVLGSAEAISDAVAGTGRITRAALSAPVIKTAALATGTSRAMKRLRRKETKAHTVKEQRSA
jgi:hypothetical protein